MNFPTQNLQPGQRGPEVEQLQQFLLSQRLLTQEQIATGPGIYGPQTTAAVRQWQENNGVDNTSGPGFWGPQSIGVASGNITGPENASGDPDQPYSDQEYEVAMMDNSRVKDFLNNGNTLEDLEYAVETGDFGGMIDKFGMPFSEEAQQAALAEATEDTRLFYEAQQSKATADTESYMAKQKSDYQDYLMNSGQQFESDKAQSDQQAANQGVLFSGGRVQKERNLERAYNQDQASKQAYASNNIGNAARDFQYKYGNEATNSLSSNYQLGSNTYNAKKATGGVGSGSLSSIYNPKQYDYQGTQNTARSAENNKRAAGFLWNKGNKLLATGSSNQY